MKQALVGAFLVLLYGGHWMLAALVIVLAFKIAAFVHDLMDCLSWIHNENYPRDEEGPYYHEAKHHDHA